MTQVIFIFEIFDEEAGLVVDRFVTFDEARGVDLAFAKCEALDQDREWNWRVLQVPFVAEFDD